MSVPPVAATYTREASPGHVPASPNARTAGLLYLLTTIMGMAAVVLEGRIIVSGNAAATAANIVANESLFRLGSAANLLATVSYLVVTALLYNLFRPVSRNVSLAAAFFSLVGCGMGAVSCATELASITILGGAPFSGAFHSEQLQALALLAIKMSGNAYTVGMIFFGFYCLTIGYLILRSTFLPRVLGILMAIAGLGWLTNFSPHLAHATGSITMVTGLLGEGALTLWLLVRGVNVQRWREQAAKTELQ